MANVISNYAKGRFVHWATLPLGTDNVIVCLFKAAGLPTDASLRDYQFLSDVITGGGVECTFTNYARKVLTASDITITVNTSTDTVTVDTVDVVWTAAGGASNDSIGKLGYFYRPTSGAANSAISCISFHDYVATTTGGNLTATVPSVATAT